MKAPSTRSQPGFAALDPPAAWPRPRGFAAPEHLDAGIDALPGVGPALKRKLTRLGLATVGDLLAHRPHRYEEPAPERPISHVFGEEEVAIAGRVLRIGSRRARGRLTIQTARVRDESGEIDAVWFNQPWLVEKLPAGTHVRLRGQRGRRSGFQVRSHDVGEAEATADYAPVYPATEDVTPKKLRELVGEALPVARALPDSLSAAPPRARAPSASCRRAARAAPAALARRGGGSAAPAGVRRAACPADRDRPPRPRARAGRGGRAGRARRADRALPPRAALRADP